MTSRLLLFALPCLLLACARPLTPSETTFAETLLGADLNTTTVTVTKGALIGNVRHSRPTRPQVACRERIFPPPKAKTVSVGTAAFVLFNQIYVAEDVFEPNFLPGYPEKMSLPHAMLFAHEMIHVWQWQNRRLTGYHPWKAANEHKPGTDPYLLEFGTTQPYLDFPFEQQAAIVEEYVCCAALDPTGSRTSRLREMLGAHLPVADLDAQISETKIFLPWKDARTRGICSLR